MIHKEKRIIEIIQLLREFTSRESFIDFVKIVAIIHKKASMLLLDAPAETISEEEENYYHIIQKY